MPIKHTKEDIPFIDPKDCPSELIKYMNRQRHADRMLMKETIKTELRGVTKFMMAANNNRLWLQVLTFIVVLLTGVLLLHIYQ